MGRGLNHMILPLAASRGWQRPQRIYCGQTVKNGLKRKITSILTIHLTRLLILRGNEVASRAASRDCIRDGLMFNRDRECGIIASRIYGQHKAE